MRKIKPFNKSLYFNHLKLELHLLTCYVASINGASIADGSRPPKKGEDGDEHS